MTRRHFAFDCEGNALAAALDEAPGETGLLIVSGGNEVRAGPWGSQAELAAAIAAAGHPVLRFDRRGIGDSEGGNGGFRSSAADIAAAVAALRREQPQVRRVVGYGNCDAASALLLHGGGTCDALVLGNPWTFDETENTEHAAAPPAAALRAHYWRRLRDPRALVRLITGGVALKGLGRSLRAAANPTTVQTGLAAELLAAERAFAGPVRYLVAGNDRTGQAFLAHWPRGDKRIARCPDASHSFVEAQARDWLARQILAALAGT